jgi:branched-chain amino acid transport system ATP-binding protein
MRMPLLEVKDLKVSYGKALAIESVSITVEKGELIGVLGPNGAGKTTLLKAISRSIAAQGTLNFKDASLHPIEPYNVVAKGICHCPEGRKLFSELSVLKNLQLGAYLRKNRAEIDSDLERVFALFPVLRERQWQHAIRRRTADGRHRPRADGPARTASAR